MYNIGIPTKYIIVTDGRCPTHLQNGIIYGSLSNCIGINNIHSSNNYNSNNNSTIHYASPKCPIGPLAQGYFTQ